MAVLKERAIDVQSKRLERKASPQIVGVIGPDCYRTTSRILGKRSFRSADSYRFLR